MLAFLKVFARGIIVTILLPIILLVLLLYGAYCIFLFIFMFFKGVIDFFKGGTFNADMKEDLEARRMLLEQERTDAHAKDMLNMMYQNTMTQAQYQNPQHDEIEDLKPSEFSEYNSDLDKEGDIPDDNGSY